MPTISIVLPTYNVSKYIERCILSIKKQDNSDFEAIFVNDCCTDNSAQIIESHCKTDSRFKIISNELNQGTFASRANGVHEATGEYVFFVDPDDELPASAISNIIKLIKKSSADIIYGKVIQPTGNSSEIVVSRIPDDSVYPNIIKSTILTQSIPVWFTPGKIYKKSLLLNVYNEIQNINKPLLYGEDALLYLLCVNKSFNFKGLHNCIYIYHSNETSITKSKSEEKLISNSNQLKNIIKIINNLITENYFIQSDALEAAKKIRDLLHEDSSNKLFEASLISANKHNDLNLKIGAILLNPSKKKLAKLFLYIITFGKLNY